MTTLSARQSSAIGSELPPSARSSMPGICGHCGKYEVARRSSVHGSTGIGGPNRSAVANGIPLNTATS